MTRSLIARELIALAKPIALYWLTNLLALVVFTGAVFTTQNQMDEGDLVAIGAVWASMLLGVLVGQVASITRLRSGIFLPGLFCVFWGAVFAILQAEALFKGIIGDIGFALLGMGMMLGSFAASGGFWSLRVNRGLVAAWVPAILFTGAIIMITENSGEIAAWHEGAKYAIWSVGTIAILGLAVVLQILFMVARESHRVHRWRTAPQAPEPVEQRPDPFRPFAGLGSLVMLGLLVVALTGASAVVAPYLWRTGPPDGENGGGQQIEGDPQEQPEPSSGSGMGGGLQKVAKYVKQGVQMGCALLTMLVLAIAALVVFGPPTRRQVLLTHLRDPLWPVPPSRRARLHWRLAEVALGDAGIHRKPGDSARDVALRGVAEFPNINLEALVTAAEIADRVMYGYALDAGDADTIRRAAEMTYQAVWENLGEVARLKATYRLL